MHLGELLNSRPPMHLGPAVTYDSGYGYRHTHQYMYGYRYGHGTDTGTNVAKIV